MSAAIDYGIMALSGVVGAVCGDAAGLFVLGDLAEQIGQHRRIRCPAVVCLQTTRGADVAPGDLDGPDLQCLLVDPEVDLARYRLPI